MHRCTCTQIHMHPRMHVWCVHASKHRCAKRESGANFRPLTHFSPLGPQFSTPSHTSRTLDPWRWHGFDAVPTWRWHGFHMVMACFDAGCMWRWRNRSQTFARAPAAVHPGRRTAILFISPSVFLKYGWRSSCLCPALVHGACARG